MDVTVRVETDVVPGTFGGQRYVVFFGTSDLRVIVVVMYSIVVDVVTCRIYYISVG